MTINKSIAFKLWNDIFGEQTLWTQDCFGTWIYKLDFNNQNN